jgi:hypothetical protein
VRDSLTDSKCSRIRGFVGMWVLVRDLRVEKMSARVRERAVNDIYPGRPWSSSSSSW